MRRFRKKQGSLPWLTLMLGFKALVKKKDFTLSGEVDSAEWVNLDKAPALLREGG